MATVADPARGLPLTHKYPQLADVKAACEAASAHLARNSVRQRAVFHPPPRPATAQEKAKVQATLDRFKRDMAVRDADDLDYRYQERAAILEYDAGLSRTEAEAQAKREIYK